MMLPLILLIAGLLLIVAELMFPSLGALGVSAAACMIAGIAVAFGQDTQLGVTFLVATAVLVPAVLMIGFKLVPKSPLGRLLINPGYSFKDGAAIDSRDKQLIGREGVAEALLRPAGTARIDGRRVDVVTRGEPIEAGTRVKVIELQGNRVVVAPLEDRA